MKRPVWIDEMQTGCWYAISGDRPDLSLPTTPIGTRCLQDNNPAADSSINPPRTAKERLRRLLGKEPAAPWRGKAGFSAITEAWNSAVFASGYGDAGSMIVFGGGHNNYFGSDMHAFDLVSREWSRISTGYVTGSPEEYGSATEYPDTTYPDGSPLPPHTYDYVQYDPAGNDFILFKGALALGPAPRAAAIPHMFNFDSLSWRRGPEHDQAILNSGGWTTWDPMRRAIWGHSGDDGGGNAFIEFHPDGANADGTFGKWGELQPNKLSGYANHNAMQISPRGNIIVIAAHEKNSLFALNPETPAAPLKRLDEDRRTFALSEYAALEYSRNLDCFVYYSANDGCRIYAVAPPAGSSWSELTGGAWHWRCLSSSESGFDPVAHAASVTSHSINRKHTFGRFRIASFDGIDLAILVRHVDTPVYVARLNP